MRGICEYEGCKAQAGAAGRHCDVHYQHPGPLPRTWPANAAELLAADIASRVEAREGVLLMPAVREAR